MDDIPYSRQSIDAADIAAVTEALQSPFLTQGPAVPRFEAAMAERHEAAHAVAMSNATSALHAACLALGLGRGDLLWTSPLSFVASSNCGLYCGASVDFVDIDPVTRNMSVEALAAKLRLAERDGQLPKIVIPVDFSGLPCDLPEIRQLADRYGFAIISDSSHAVGATLRDRPVGSRFSDITVFSFHPVKIITTAEGGMCVTQEASLAEKLRLLRSHGITRDPARMAGVPDGPWYYEQIALGFNFRMTDLQAALGTSQLSRLSSLQSAREERTRQYDSHLRDLPLRLPVRLADRQSAHHLYVVEVDETRTSVDRAAVFQALLDAGIRPNVHYIPIHLQPYYRALGFVPGDFPMAEAYYRRTITLPLFPNMTDAQIERVMATLREVLA